MPDVGYKSAIKITLLCDAQQCNVTLYKQLCSGLWDKRITHYDEYLAVSSTNFFLCKEYQQYDTGYTFGDVDESDEDVFVRHKKSIFDLYIRYHNTCDEQLLRMIEDRFAEKMRKSPIYCSLLLPFNKKRSYSLLEYVTSVLDETEYIKFMKSSNKFKSYTIYQDYNNEQIEFMRLLYTEGSGVW